MTEDQRVALNIVSEHLNKMLDEIFNTAKQYGITIYSDGMETARGDIEISIDK